MMWRLSVTIVASLCTLATSSSAFSAEIVGTVADLLGKPVKSVQLSVKNGIGKSLASTTPDSKGHYQISGLKEGQYNYVLESHTAGIKGGQTSGYLGSKGLSLDWKVSTAGPATVVASAGIGAAVAAGTTVGLSSAAFGAAVAGGSIAAVAGGVVGGYAATGGFSSSPASPSL
jgi:hypothetical protein